MPNFQPLKTYPVTERCIGGSHVFDDAPNWIYSLDNPYLHGVYAPIVDEIEANQLTIEGELPKDLAGAYLRNGPNPVFAPPHNHHPFDGDAMVHGVYIQDGKASYRNRYVQTLTLLAEQARGKSTSPGVMGPFNFAQHEFGIKDTANTDVCFHNGSVAALWYNAGNPMALDPHTLKTQGGYTLTNRPTHRMSAHSKVDPATGELLFFDYGDKPPFMTYGVADAQGNCVHEVEIPLPGPRLPHDMGFTQHYAILHDLPFFHDTDILAKHNRRVVTFHRDLPIRFGVIPRRGQSHEVRWFECQPGYVLHTSNCWEEGDWLIMDGCRSTNPMPKADTQNGELSHMLAYMRLEANAYRWRLNLKTGEVREGHIDNLNTEFNKANALYLGQKSRFSYHQHIPLLHEGGHTLRFTGLVKYNNDTGQRQQWSYGKNVFGSEAVYAPKIGATPASQEDDGYVVNFVIDSNTWLSSCLIFDAKDIQQGPICRIQLPHRVPTGFHATWVRGEELWSNH
mgnify:CR=1 FL=1